MSPAPPSATGGASPRSGARAWACSAYAGGGFAPQRGSICMDMCMVDLTDLPQVDVGSEVEIFGKHNDINALSAAAQTIPYELLCAVSKRVPRVYKQF